MINLESEAKKEEEVDCSAINTLEKNYHLNCEENETITSDLQSAISFFDGDNILLVNFYSNIETKIELEETKDLYQRYFYSKKSGVLKPGAIVAILIVSIVILGVIIFIIYYSKKESNISN